MHGVLKKAALGTAVTVVFFAAVEGILFLAGVTPLSQKGDPYVGFAGYSPLFVEAMGPDGGRVFRTADAKIDWFNPQQFPAERAPGVQRIFCLGGSTTYGRPYDDATSFCGWLRAFLPAADPTTTWEVVNAGGISYASYRVVRLMEELADHQPDLFVVYTGHNEFLERRTYERLLRAPEAVRDMGALASRLRLYSALSDAIYPKPDVLDTEIDALLDNSIGPEDYHRDDTMRDAVVEHFRRSLERMARVGRAAGAQLVFVTPSSNIRDFSPFKAEPGTGLDEATLGRLQALEASIAERLEGEDFDEAARLADQALAIDPRHADLLFMRGRALLGQGRTDEARRVFVEARDEDVAPLRALSNIIRATGEVATATSSGLIDFDQMMREASPGGIPGDEHFLDHVHPSIDAHRLLALAIVDEMIEGDLIVPAPTWNDDVIEDISERVKGGVDDAANARALANLARVLSWAGKQDEALRAAERATGLMREPHTVYQMLLVLRRSNRDEEALLYSEEAARLMPEVADVRKLRGVILSENGRSAEALREFEAAARLDPSMTEIHYHLGVVLSDLGQMQQAEQAYRTAIQSQPTNPDALNNLGILLAQRGDVRGALEMFERAVEAEPGHEGARQNLERARSMVGG